MLNLLNETFTRVRKSVQVWVSLILLIAIGLVIIFVLNMGQSKMYNSFMLLPLQFMMYLVPYNGFFISRDYTNGTIRNKIVLGYSREKIYMTNWLLLSAVVIAEFLVFVVLMYSLGGAVLGFSWDFEFVEFVKIMVLALFNILAFSSVAVMLCMCFQGVSGTVWSFFIYMILEVLTLIAQLATMKNEELNEKIYKFMGKLLPPAQASYLLGIDEVGSEDWKLIAYSIGVIVFTTGIGMLVFKKKNIK